MVSFLCGFLTRILGRLTSSIGQQIRGKMSISHQLRTHCIKAVQFNGE